MNRYPILLGNHKPPTGGGFPKAHCLCQNYQKGLQNQLQDFILTYEEANTHDNRPRTH